MKKIVNIFLLTPLVAIGLQSCGEFLDVEPNFAIDEKEAITNVQNSTAALTGVYDGLQHYNSYGRDYVVFGDVLTNNIKVSPTNSNRFTAQAAWKWTPFTGDFADYWNRAYNTINRANNIINADIKGDIKTVDQIVGEAYALRALIYFDLVRLFAQDYNYTSDHSHLGVPYVTVSDPYGRPSRNTVAEVYQGILSDLSEAEKRVKDSRLKTPYTISPNAIKALYARIYLYIGDYQKAAEYAESLILNTKYSLVPNSAYLASWAAESTSESIFTLTHDKLDYQGTNALGYIYIEAGYGDLLANPDFVNMYDQADVRRGWFVMGVADSKKNNIYLSGKYPGRGTPGLDNYNIFRISEMYLIAAEALARTNKEQAAIGYLDAIRQRALPSAPKTTAQGQALIDAVLLEKRKELAFEGHYFHDLKRLRLTITGPTTGSGAIGPVINNGDYRLAWPIPQREIDANPNIAKQQNPGY